MEYMGGAKNMGVDWNYFNKFGKLGDTYMPYSGEGETMASQIVTAVNKLIYKWYNDGDVFDNTRYLEGWANDLSSYANWLAKYTHADAILKGVWECYEQSDYEQLLKELADELLDEAYLSEMGNKTEQICAKATHFPIATLLQTSGVRNLER